jgi:hypothetical protein
MKSLIFYLNGYRASDASVEQSGVQSQHPTTRVESEGQQMKQCSWNTVLKILKSVAIPKVNYPDGI